MQKLSSLIKESILSSTKTGKSGIKIAQLKVKGKNAKDIVQDIQNAIEEISYVYYDEMNVNYTKSDLEQIKKELKNYIDKFFELDD